MKKIIVLFNVTVLTLVSCSSDDGGSTPVGSNLKPSEIVTAFAGTTQISTSTFTYDGNKIVEKLIVPSFDVSKIKYTYTGDLITKIEEYGGTDFDLYSTKVYTYENGKLKSSTSSQGTFNFPYNKENYIHNADGTVTLNSINVDQTTGIETPVDGSAKSYFTDGNMTKTEFLDASGTVGRTYNFTYETGKFHAFKNVIGFDKIALAGTNNLASITFSGTPVNVTNYTSMYNSDNYPTQIQYPAYNGTQTETITY